MTPKPRQRKHQPQPDGRQKRGRWFEHATWRILGRLRGPASVYQNVRIYGRLSKVSREVDVQQVDPTNYEFVAFECKDHARPLHVEKVEAFATKLVDIGAAKGAIVSNSGFSPAALNVAEALGIDTLALVDTDEPAIKTRIAATTLVRDLFVAGIRIVMPSGRQPPRSADDLLLLKALWKEEEASRVIAAAWNDRRIPHQPGFHTATLAAWGFIKWRTGGSEGSVQEITLSVRVDERCSLGELAILESQGLYDVRTKQYESRNFRTEFLDVAVLPTWSRLSSAEADELQNRGGVTLSVEVSTVAVEPESG